MQYTAWIAHDYQGAAHDCRIVTAKQIDVLQRRMAREARDLLETYFPGEKRADGVTVKPLPLVRFDGAATDIARHARRELDRTRCESVCIGDMRWPLSFPLDQFTVSVEARR